MNSSARELKRRLKSVASTQQMTKAMKTVAVSKYNKVSSLYDDFEPYGAQCEHLLSILGGEEDPAPEEIREDLPVCYVAVTGNRGLCGMYNIELMRFLQEQTAAHPGSKVVMCGKWGKDNAGQLKGAEIIRCFPLSDIPQYSQARELCDYMKQLHAGGEYSQVCFAVQRFKNVLVQTPELIPFPPRREARTQGGGDYIFLPERAELTHRLEDICTASYVYRVLLNCARGVHGATLAAMRTASDNSDEMYAELSQTLNRLRQSSATTEVIELSGAAAAGEETGDDLW